MSNSPRRIIAGSIFLLWTMLGVTDASAKRQAVHHPEPVNGYAQGGYANRTSVLQGEEITFHIASTKQNLTIDIINLAEPDVVVRSFPGIDTSPQDCRGRYSEGCGWAPTVTMRVPLTWPSGYYAARFPTAEGTRYTPFVVRARNAGNASPILVISSTNTYQAHNTFGGRSLQSSQDGRTEKVSFDRPYQDEVGLGRFLAFEDTFVRWMRDQAIAFEVASDHDLEDPSLLSRYNVVVLVGHSSYWTASARQNLETFLAGGGHIAIFGGNTMWWQARMENGGRTLVAYKDAEADPATGSNNSVVTVNWFDYPVFKPENMITGTSFRHGGYANRDGDPATWSDDPSTFRSKPVEERIGYTVRDPGSWVFEGTNVQVGQAFGRDAAGLEVDAPVFNCDANGLPGAPDGSDGTPLNYEILAYTRAYQGYGTVGIYTTPAGGAVFNAATQQWVGALFTDPVVERITQNVLTRFATGARLPHTPVSAAPRLRDLFNCPQPHTNVIPWWEGSIGSAALSQSCAYEGPTGLEIKGSGELSIARNFTPTGQPLNTVEARFYVNATSFVFPNALPVPLVTLRGRQGESVERLAQVEMFVLEGQRVVRIAVLRADGTINLASAWTPLPNGWQSVQFGWRPAGEVTLQVGDGTALTLTNPRSSAGANEVVLYRPAMASPSGTLCVDALAIGADKIPAVTRTAP